MADFDIQGHHSTDKGGKRRRRKLWLLYFLVAGNVLFLALATYYLFFVNTATVKVPLSEVSVVRPLEIDFNKKVSHDADITLSPAAAYSANWSDSLITSNLKLSPATRWLTNTTYTLTVDGVTTTLDQKVQPVDYSFHTQEAPIIVSSTPKRDSTNVAIDTQMTLQLDSPNENLISPKLVFSPPIKNTLSLSADKTIYTINFREKLWQSTEYKLTVYDDFKHVGKTGLKIYQTAFSTVPKVQIADFSPTGNMNFKDSKFKIAFDHDMDHKSVENALSISPATKGTLSWTDNRTLVFSPSQNLQLGTTYWVKLAAGVKNTSGGTLETDYTNSFGTIGYVTAWISPGWGTTEVDLNTLVKVYFNQDVDHNSAQNEFTISPSVHGSFSWYGDTMIFSPSNQGYLTNYYISENPGVISINGLNSADTFSTSFTTVTPVVLLPVPYHSQIYPLSCEAASLVMALGEKGVSVSEDDLLWLIGTDGPSQMTMGYWGNPNRGFVGSVSGNGTTTGYGVYWGPVAKAAQHYRSAKSFSSGSLQTLTGAIDAGNPVIIWGTTGDAYPISWTDYKTGGIIAAVKGEHARVVRGYRGFASNPIGFYLSDPIAGEIYWDTDTLLGNWSWFGNSGVIVY